MSKINLICETLAKAFPTLENCLKITEAAKVLITDYKNDGCFIIEFDPNNQPFIKLNGTVELEELDDSKLFTIKEVKRKAFLPIDGRKGLIGFGTTQCDSIFFDENDFCFIEFKLNAVSSSNSAINKNREKAINQLLNTITEFDNRLSRNYRGLSLEAYVCTPDFYPRLNASWQELAEDFLEQHGILLFEINEKICK